MGSELLRACAFSTVKCGPGQETSLTVGFKASVIKCAPAELLKAVAIFSGCYPLDQILARGPMNLPVIQSKVYPVSQLTPFGRDRRGLQ